MMNLTIKAPAFADVDILDVLVKVVDHLREDDAYSAEDRAHGINCAEGVIRVLKTKIGNRTIVGLGRVGG